MPLLSLPSPPTRFKLLLFGLMGFLLSGGLSLQAQVLLKASDRTIRYDLIKPSHTFAKVMAYDTLGNLKYEFVNESIVKVDAVHGEITFARARQVPFGKNYLDSSVVSRSGPIRYTEVTSPLTKQLTIRFSPRAADAQAFINNVRSRQQIAMPEGYFDDNIVEDVLGYLPLKKGIKYRLVAYRYETKGGLNPYEIEYVFDDFLHQSNGAIADCSVLHFTNAYQSAYCWIDKKTRANLKIVVHNKDTHVVVLGLLLIRNPSISSS